MRISKSIATRPIPPQEQQPPMRRRSSFDNLVIPHRTRFPSSRISQIEAIDLAVARNLLDAAAQQAPAASGDAASSEPRDSFESSSSTESDQQQGTPPGSSGEFYIRHHDSTASWAACRDADDERRYRSSSSSSAEWKHQQHELGNSYDGPIDSAARDADRSPYMSHAAQAGNVDVLRMEAAEAAKEYKSLAKVHGLAAFGVIQDYGQC